MKTFTLTHTGLASLAGAAVMLGALSTSSSAASRCWQERQANYQTARRIHQQCKRILRSINYSACRGSRAQRACLRRVSAPHQSCLKRAHQAVMYANREYGQCQRRTAVARQKDRLNADTSVRKYGRVNRGVRRSTNLIFPGRRFSNYRRHLKRRLKQIGRIHKYSLRRFGNSMRRFNRGTSRPTYRRTVRTRYVPRYRKTYRRSYRTYRRSYRNYRPRTRRTSYRGSRRRWAR